MHLVYKNTVRNISLEKYRYLFITLEIKPYPSWSKYDKNKYQSQKILIYIYNP